MIAVLPHQTPIAVIPAKAGIQGRMARSRPLDPRFRGGDDIRWQ